MEIIKFGGVHNRGAVHFRGLRPCDGFLLDLADRMMAFAIGGAILWALGASGIFIGLYRLPVAMDLALGGLLVWFLAWAPSTAWIAPRKGRAPLVAFFVGGLWGFIGLAVLAVQPDVQMRAGVAPRP